MEHIDEFLAGLSKEELDYICDRAELMLQEMKNSSGGEAESSEKEDSEVSMDDFEKMM